MRLSADQIKDALLHADKDIRQAAASYFARSCTSDTSVMLQVIAAIRQYGWQDAFEDDTFMNELAQCEESIEWMIEEIGRHDASNDDPSELEEYVVSFLWSTLLEAPPQLLQAREEKIRGLRWPDDDLQRAFDVRLRLATLSADDLWAEFESFWPGDYANDSQVEGCLDSLAAAMALHPAELTESILGIIADYEHEPDDFWVPLAIRVAGNMRLQAAVGELTELAVGTDPQLFFATQRALARIGSDSIVDALVGMYHEVDLEEQLSTAFYLECIPSDKSVAACLQLQAEEGIPLIRIRMLQAALMNFATEAIEPAAQLIRELEPDRDTQGLRAALLLACKLSGERFPEYDAWLADAACDADTLLYWYRPRSSFFPDDEDEFDDGEFGEGEFLEGEFEDEEFDDDEIAEPAFDLPYDVDDVPESPPTTIVKQVPQVGRNEPCPCGSGKKFKKCCYQKMSAENAADTMRATEGPLDILSTFGRSPVAGANSQTSMKPPQPTSACYEIKVTLEGIKPAIWRRIVVPDMTLDLFHSVMQVTMGWHNEHLYQFTDGKTDYTVPAEYGAKDAGLTLLSTIVQGKRKRFEYMYDFGDSWRHSINVERILLPEETTPHATCLEGENACPPEDIGGTHGYAKLLGAYENPELHDSIEGWDFDDEEQEFDPKAFDRDAVNVRLERFTAEAARSSRI